MKLLQRKYREPILVLAIFAALTTLSWPQLGQKFPKISFWDPWILLKSTSPSTALTYYGQIDSMGINTILSAATPQTTANGYGLVFIGEDTLYYRDATRSVEFNSYTHVANKVTYQAEIVFASAVDYIFDHPTGVADIDTDAVIDSRNGSSPRSRKGQAGIDAAGFLINNLQFGKSFLKFFNCSDTLFGHFRLKVANNTSNDTVCDLYLIDKSADPDKIMGRKSLKASDFTASNQYQIFDIFGFTCPVPPFMFIDVQVYWRGNVTLWVDQVEVEDTQGRLLTTYLNQAKVDTVFINYYNAIDTSRLLRWYPSDEISPSQYVVQKWFDTHCSGIGARRKTTMANYYELEFYADEVQPLELLTENYIGSVITNNHDSATTGTSASIQNAFDNANNLTLYYGNVARWKNLPYWIFVQAYGDFRPDAPATHARDPQPGELKAQVFLALAHGAKGIGYFLYPSTYSGAQLTNVMKYIAGDSLGTPVTPPSSQLEFHGVVDKSPTTGRYEPNYKYYALRNVDSTLDKIGPTVLSLSWDTAWVTDANGNLPTAKSNPVTKITSAQFPTNPWVHQGLFTGQDGSRYFLLVNRRVLSSEGQDVTAWLSNANHTYVIDISTGDTILTGNTGSSGAPFTVHLNPGEGKLFKVVSAPTYINGSSFPLTWQGKITIDGDVTVSSGKTLKILPPQAKLSFLARKDTLHTGQDVNRSELLINGSLRANGTSGDQVKFVSASTTPDTNDWYGIQVSGSAKLQHCIIRHAYTGISYGTFSPDTMKNVQIARCKIYGVWLSISPNVVIQNCRIDSINANPGGTGIYIDPYYNTGSGRLIKDTIRACYYGVYAYEGKFPIDSCVIIGPGNTGIVCDDQVQFDTSQRVPITATKITGYFSGQLFLNSSNGWANLSGCDLVSDTSPRSPYGIRSSDIWTYLKLRKTKVIDWGSVGVSLRHNSSQIANLGIDDPLFPDSGLNNINTSKPGWDEETGKTIVW